MICFAYDGSIDGDWVLRYAIRMAAHSLKPELHLVHVREDPQHDLLAAKIDRIEHECRLHNVRLTVSSQPLQGDLFATLVGMLTSDGVVVCGMRSVGHKASKRGYLKQSIARRLLEHPDLDVLALRVLHPGLLGSPRRLLLPLHPTLPRPQQAANALQLLGPGLTRIHILELISAGRLPFRRSRLLRRRHQARAQLSACEEALAEALSLSADCFDTGMRLTHAWPREIIMRASRHKSQLIFMGLPRRTLVQQLAGIYPVEEILRNAPCDIAVFGGKRE